MTYDYQKLHDEIQKAVIQGIQKTCDDILNTALDTNACYVPRDTGFLASSGSVNLLPNGGEVVFRASYAADVEGGAPARPWPHGPHQVTVRAHDVKGYVRKDGTYVKPRHVEEQKRTYSGARVVSWRPKIPGTKQREQNRITRVLKEQPAQKGQFFLTRATMDSIGNLTQNIEVFLNRLNGRRF
jgi:hypothetical protein